MSNVKLPIFVVSYRNSTSNHNFTPRVDYSQGLYLIEILHQTTTPHVLLQHPRCCILSKFYIKPQPWADYAAQGARCILSKFYIKPQLPDVQVNTGLGCILSKFYIKPQQRGHHHKITGRCILSKFYIKPQL